MTCLYQLTNPRFLEEDRPENVLARLVLGPCSEINLTNAFLFSNMYLEPVDGTEKLVQVRLFSHWSRSPWCATGPRFSLILHQTPRLSLILNQSRTLVHHPGFPHPVLPRTSSHSLAQYQTTQPVWWGR